MKAISLDNIQLVCGIPYSGIEALQCKETVNEHTTIDVRLLILPETAKWFDRQSLCNQKLKIEMKLEDAEHASMCGDIIFAQWETIGTQFYVDIHAVSGTKRLDMTPKKACFQQIDQTYAMLLKSIAEDSHATCLIMEGKEKTIRYPVIQYLETDWELLRRITAHLNTVIMVNSEQESPRFSIGCVEGKEYRLETSLHIKKIFTSKGNLFSVNTWENYKLGDRVNLYGVTLAVFEKETRLKKGLIEHTYLLGNKKNFILLKAENEKLRGVSLRGKVLAVQGERIKLELGLEKKVRTEKLYAYRYLPITGNIMYAMPEVGTEAELYFPTPDIKDAYIRNCFLPKSNYPDSSVKFMKTRHRKMLEMNPDEIMWQTQSGRGETESISLMNTMGMKLNGSDTLSLTADNDIMICAGASCRINSTGSVRLEQTDTINMLQMYGNSVRMSAECYEVASDSSKGVREEKTEVLWDMSEVNQSVLAAIPMRGCDSLTMQLAASIPQILSVNSLLEKGTGFFN